VRVRILDATRDYLDKGCLVESQQVGPSPVRLDLIVDGSAVLARNVRQTPPMQGAIIDFDLRRKLGLGEGRLQLSFASGCDLSSFDAIPT